MKKLRVFSRLRYTSYITISVNNETKVIPVHPFANMVIDDVAAIIEIPEGILASFELKDNEEEISSSEEN